MRTFGTRTGREEQLSKNHPSWGAPARSRRWRRPRLAALVGVLAVRVAGCGGGGGKSDGVARLGGAGSATSTTTANAGEDIDPAQAALNYGRCMRQDGVDLPDPRFGRDNIVQTLPDRTVRNSAKFKVAEQACKPYLPNGGQPDPQADSQMLQQMLALPTSPDRTARHRRHT